jgi:hypothetical protein
MSKVNSRARFGFVSKFLVTNASWFSSWFFDLHSLLNIFKKFDYYIFQNNWFRWDDGEFVASMGEIAVGLAKSTKARAKLVSFFPAKSPISNFTINWDVDGHEQLFTTSCSRIRDLAGKNDTSFARALVDFARPTAISPMLAANSPSSQRNQLFWKM